MAKVTAEQIAKLQEKANQQIAKLQAAKARMAETERKLDTRRKIIAGGLLFDAAAKDKQWARHLATLLTRIDRPNDQEPFDGWTIEQYKAEGGKLGARKRSQEDTESEPEEIETPEEESGDGKGSTAEAAD